jgi:rubrerythrin
MSIILSNADLTNLAIDIEKKGVAFYDIMARTSDDAKLRRTFQFLSEMERQHVKVFQKIFSSIDQNAKSGADGEEGVYIQTLMDNSAFTDDFVSSELVNRIQTDIQALELSIIAEKDSLIFYFELIDQLGDPNRELVKQIISEEKRHILQLSEIKKELRAQNEGLSNQENPGGKG